MMPLLIAAVIFHAGIVYPIAGLTGWVFARIIDGDFAL